MRDLLALVEAAALILFAWAIGTGRNAEATLAILMAIYCQKKEVSH